MYPLIHPLAIALAYAWGLPGGALANLSCHWAFFFYHDLHMGGKRSTWKKTNTQAWRKHANSTQKGRSRSVGSTPRPSCRGATNTLTSKRKQRVFFPNVHNSFFVSHDLHQPSTICFKIVQLLNFLGALHCGTIVSINSTYAYWLLWNIFNFVTYCYSA